MTMPAALIAGLIGGPLLLGLLIGATSAPRWRAGLVLGGSLAAMIAGAFLATCAPLTVELPVELAYAGRVGEALMGAVFLLIGWRIRNAGVVLLSLVQLAFAGLNLAAPAPAHAPRLVLDNLASVLVLVICLVGGPIVFYSVGYMRRHEHHAPPTAASTARFQGILIAFLGLMNGLVLSDDLSWLSVFWEGTTLCSFFLIGQDGTPESRRNAARALLLNTFGGVLLGAGGWLSARQAGAESLSALLAAPTALTLLPVTLMVAATFTKSAQFPFQSWLLGAMVAPTPVSALLHSSTMVKAGSYLILRLVPAFENSPIAPLVALYGAFTFAVGSALAISQPNAKRVLAYSTIANLGLIVVCAGTNTPLAFAAALMVLVFHAVTKALLFLCVGTIEQGIGSRHIEDMSGILYKMPLTTGIAIAGMFSMFVPPSGMLLGKWMAIEAVAHAPLVMLLVVVGSALTVFFWAKWLGRIATASHHERYKSEHLPASMSIPLVGLALSMLAMGLGSLAIYHLWLRGIAIDSFAHILTPAYSAGLLCAVDDFLAWPMLMILCIVALAGFVSTVVYRRPRIGLPYLCGENAGDSDLSYKFYSSMDRKQTALVTSYYLSPVFGEATLTTWVNWGAALLLASLLARTLL